MSPCFTSLKEVLWNSEVFLFIFLVLCLFLPFRIKYHVEREFFSPEFQGLKTQLAQSIKILYHVINTKASKA